MSASMDWPTETWWSAYKDPQLESLISQTVSGSPTLRIAQIRVRLAQAFQDSRHADTLPNISTEGSFVREHFTERQFIPPPWAGHSDWNNQLTASLAYDLDLWGRQKSLWQASVSEVRATKIEVQQVRLELITTVVRTYIQLAMQYSLRDIAEAHLLQIKQRIAISKRSLFAGLGTEMEVTEAETPLPTLVAKIEAINSRIGLIQNQLAVLSGQGPEVGDTIKRPSMMLKVDIGLPDHLPANLIGRRPDILAYRWRVQAAQKQIKGAKAAFYPNINLLSFIGFQALGFGQMVSNASSITGVGPALSLPIFDGGQRRSHLSATTANYDIALENYNTGLICALQEVADQLLILQSNAQQLDEAEKSVALAQKANALASTSYHAGLTNFQHMLEKQSIFLRENETLTELQTVRLDAYAGLMRALGGGAFDAAAANMVKTP